MIGARETDIQAAVVAWAELMTPRWPDLASLHAVQNWAGVKSPREGAQRKREGVKAGVPDLHLPVARGGYFGLYIEMKRETVRVGKRGLSTSRTKTTEEQDIWHVRLRLLGHRVVVCWTAAEAQAVLERYLSMPPTQVVSHAG